MQLGQESVLINAMQQSSIDPDRIPELLQKETRWHYSQHFNSEMKGEEVLEDMLALAYSPKARTILNMQLRDELNHCRIFQSVVDTIGLDSRANSFGNDYSNLVKTQRTLAEKVFVFELLVEAVSLAYCTWRLQNVSDGFLKAADQVVHSDEMRHLKMAKPLLTLCDRDQLRTALTPERQKELLRQMNLICHRSSQIELVHHLCPEGVPLREERKSSSLDREVIKTVLREARAASELIEKAFV